ncbi:MAG: TolC family protein [Thermoanaerobaculia bacterium]
MLQRTLCGLLAAAALAPAAFGQPPGGTADPGDPPQPALTGSDGRTLDRRALIAAVLERNRDLAAARRAVAAARARADEVRGLPDLTASYSLAPLSPFDSDVSYGQVVEVGQELPWPGTLARRGEQAEALADAIQGELEALRRELALAASQGFDDYQYVERALALNVEHLELVRAFQEVATARYAAGIGPQQAPLAAEVEVTHLEHREVVLLADRSVLVARLNSLLHRPVTAALPPPPKEAAPLAHAAEPSAAEAIELALSRPEIAAVRARIRADETAVALARLEGRPDFRPMASYNSMWDMGAHRWMVGLGLSLPVWRERVRAGVAAAEGELAAERQRLAALEDRVAAEVSAAVDRLAETRHVIALFENRRLPAARDQARAARSGFETGQVDFLAVIDAERNLRDIELGLADAQAEAQRRLAALQQAVGVMPGDPWPPALSHDVGGDPAPVPSQPRPDNLAGVTRSGRRP